MTPDLPVTRHVSPRPAASPGFFRRARFWIFASIGVILVTLVVAWGSMQSTTAGVALSASSPSPNGAMAVAEVLRQQGVTVVEADTLRAASAAASDGATVLLYDPDGLLTAEQYRGAATIGARTVLVAPHFTALTALTSGVGFGGVADDGLLEADCSLPAARRAEQILPGGDTFRATTTHLACFTSSSGASTLIELTGPDGDPLTLVGSTQLLANDTVDEAGNAALVLGLLGADADLIWYLPTLADVVVTGPPDIGELTPGWVSAVLGLLAVTALAAMIWRGRRFGPLVIENLPVTVTASETMEGRARLYQRSAARGRALDAIRIGTLSRLAAAAGLPRQATVDQIITRVAALTGDHPARLTMVLVDAHPRNDAELVQLSDQLVDIERAVAAATRPAPRFPETERMNE